MLEVLVYFIIGFLIIYFIIRGFSSIFKGITFLILALFLFNLITTKIGNINFSYSKILENFMQNVSVKKIFTFYELRVIGYYFDSDSLFIVVKNEGILPIKDVKIYLDETPVIIKSKPYFLLPGKSGVIEVEKREFKKITLIVANKKVEVLR